MKCRLAKSEIQDVLSKVQGLTGRKTNLAITANVLIQAESDSVKITATDLETDFTGIYPAVVETPGAIAINARKFYEIIRNFPSNEIDIHEVENRWIEIGGDKVEYHIVGMNPEDFPDVATHTDVDFMEVDAFSVKKMIEKTIAIPAPSDEKRVHIIGVLFERLTDENGPMMRMVSTDARRMAKYDIRLEENFSSETQSVLVPKKALSEVHKFIDSDGIVKIGTAGNRFLVIKETESFSVNLLEGEFPPYGDLVKTDPATAIPMERQDFLMTLRRMAILSSEAYRSVIFSFDQDRLTVTASNPDLGESREEMEIPYDRDALEVAFNPKFFIEALSAIDDDQVSVHLRDGRSPCLVRAASDESYLSIIMPMKI